MEHKFRIKLNLFDIAIILIALIAGGVVLFLFRAPADADPAAPAAVTTEYTVRLKKTLPGTGALVQPGDALTDVVKNTALGTVVSATVKPATESIVDEENLRYVTAEIPGYEDIDIVIASTVTYGEESVLVGGGYELRVGESIFVRGPGYLGSGKVYAIERGN